MSELYWLTDEQMARLQPYFPKSRGKAGVDDRRVLSGIIFVNRNGSRWCDARPHKTLYNRTNGRFRAEWQLMLRPLCRRKRMLPNLVELASNFVIRLESMRTSGAMITNS